MNYLAIRDCYYSDGKHKHRYFTAGQVLPEGWNPDANGCTHFAPASEAKRLIKDGKDKPRALTAGDDPRGTEELRQSLRKYIKVVPGPWKRKKIWSELIKRENASSKDAVTNPKEK